MEFRFQLNNALFGFCQGDCFFLGLIFSLYTSIFFVLIPHFGFSSTYHFLPRRPNLSIVWHFIPIFIIIDKFLALYQGPISQLDFHLTLLVSQVITRNWRSLKKLSYCQFHTS